MSTISADFALPPQRKHAAADHAWWIFLAAGLVGIASFKLLPEQFQIYGYTVFGASGVLAVFGGTIRNRPMVAFPWYGLAASLALLVAGDLILNNYTALFGKEAPFPNIADALFIAGNLSVALMLGLLARRRAAPGDAGSYVDALIVVTTAAVLSWIFLMVPYARDPSLTLLQKLVAIAYPSFDLAMLVVAARLIFAGGMRTPAFWLVIGALTAGMVTDTVFSVLVLEYGEIGRGHIVELGWLLWWVLWGAGALHPSMRTLTETGPERPLHITGRRLAVLASIALIVPGAGFVEGLRSGISDQMVIAAGSATLFGLVLWRMHDLTTAVEAARNRLSLALGRERVLRSASASLVAAPDREGICNAALAAITELTGPAMPVRILLGNHEALTVVASAGGERPTVTAITLSGSELEAQCAVLRAARSLFLPQEAAPVVWDALGIGEWPEICLLPLAIGSEQCGLIVLAGLDSQREGVTAGLEVLASQVALALERTTLAESLLRRQSEERFQTLVRNASDIILIVEASGVVQYASPSVERVLGYDPKCLAGQDSFLLIHPEDQPEVRSFHDQLAESPGVTRAIEFRMRHKRGEWHYVEAIATNLLTDPTVQGVVINIRDITERKEAEERLVYQAFHDPLTDLPNRALFMDRLHIALARAARRDEEAAILFLDLDRFKVVNDSLGHEAGDRLLVAVAQRLKTCLREGDTAARLGGDEFIILLEDVHSVDEAVAVADRVAGELRRPFTIDHREVFVTASIGITISRPMQRRSLDLLREADIAMYQAKARGKAGWAVFDAEMGTAAMKRLELETDLRRAIERHEFEVYYQPAIDLDDGRVAAMEALVRWRHPERGLVSPIEFITLCEETGLIVPLGRAVLEQACTQGVQWRERYGAGAPSVSVNLSARQVEHPAIVDDIAAILDRTGLPAPMLTLEVTETFAVQDAESNRETLQRLKSLGVHLAIDDFGRGYSSLGYLKQLPVDILKIDRTFVQNLDHDPEDAAIVAAVTTLAHTLGMRVTAEGVETAQQVERIRTLGVDLGQGYFFSKPLTAELATALLEMNALVLAERRTAPAGTRSLVPAAQ